MDDADETGGEAPRMLIDVAYSFDESLHCQV
jgi:hypothetical protein